MKYSSLFSLFIVLDSVVSVQATFSNPSSVFALRKGILRRNLVSLNMNIFDVFSIGESMDEVNPDEAPIEALCPIGSVYDDVRSFAVAERAISFTGEDFDIYESGSPFARVRGAMLHLPGKDKMILFSQQTNQKVAQLDRKLVSMTPTYDIYNGASDKVAWIEKDTIALTDSFSVYKEGSGIGMFKEPAVYRISGDFIDRNFVMKNEKGKTVARVKKVRFHLDIVIQPCYRPTRCMIGRVISI